MDSPPSSPELSATSDLDLGSPLRHSSTRSSSSSSSPPSPPMSPQISVRPQSASAQSLAAGLSEDTLSPMPPGSYSGTIYSSASESEGVSVPRGLRKKRLQGSPSTPVPSPKQRKNRRKSRNSEAMSEKSARSDAQWGSGYTSTPTAGKIFRNLLILEESLRQQVIQQRTLRRKYLTFLAALCSLIAAISHHLYLGTPSAPLRVFLQLILLMLCVTLLLYHLSGEYQKTIVLPRKFLFSTNKGLRQLNVRLVKVRSSFINSTAELAREFGLFLCTMALKLLHTAFPSCARNPDSRLEVWLVSGQSRCQPRFGLNDVKLVLIPRTFSTDIREGWEVYRDEFWINEGIRRRHALLSFTEKKKDKLVKRKRKSSLVRPDLTENNLRNLDLSPQLSTNSVAS